MYFSFLSIFRKADMTFEEIYEYCKVHEKRNGSDVSNDALFKVVITTNLGEFEHICRPRYYEWNEDKLINIQCDIIAYTRKLGHDKRFSLNDGDFDEGSRKCRVSVAKPADLALYINSYISDEGKRILSEL